MTIDVQSFVDAIAAGTLIRYRRSNRRQSLRVVSTRGNTRLVKLRANRKMSINSMRLARVRFVY